jgi:hypothetical protein
MRTRSGGAEMTGSWEPLFECGGCGDNTRGHIIACEAYDLYRDGSTGNSSDED